MQMRTWLIPPKQPSICNLKILLYFFILSVTRTTADVTKGNINDIRSTFLTPLLALEMSRLSRLVYLLDTNNSTTFEEKIRSDRYDTLGWIDYGSTEVLILRTIGENDDEQQGKMGYHVPKGRTIVIFRGSEEIADWIVNVDQVKVPFGSPNHTLEFPMYQPSSSPGGKPEEHPILAHRGFNRVFAVYDDILSLLPETSKEPLYVTGHSLGGANAALFSTLYAFHHPTTPTITTTFGAPRPGNRGFKLLAEQLRNLNLWRVVNARDVVPRVPAMGFWHAGHLVWRRPEWDEEDREKETGNGQVRAYYRQTGSRKEGWKGTPDFLLAVVKGVEEVEDLIEDHYMPEYIEWLEAAWEYPEVNFTNGYERID